MKLVHSEFGKYPSCTQYAFYRAVLVDNQVTILYTATCGINPSDSSHLFEKEKIMAFEFDKFGESEKIKIGDNDEQKVLSIVRKDKKFQSFQQDVSDIQCDFYQYDDYQ